MANCKLANNMGNNLTKSDIGVNGVSTGATVDDGFIGSGSRVDAAGEYTTFTSVALTDHNELIIEHIVETDYVVTNGIPQDGAHHFLWRIYDSAGAWGTLELILAVGIRFSGASGNMTLDTTSDWSAGDKKHIVLVISKSTNFDGSKTVALYIDGVQTGSSTNAITDRPNNNNYVRMGNWSGGSFPIDGVQNKLRIYQTVSAALVAEITSANRLLRMFGGQKRRAA